MQLHRARNAMIVHSAISMAIVIPAGMTVCPLWCRWLLPFWGLIFFTFFYLRGQDVRPRPWADLVSGLRLVCSILFVSLVFVSRIPAWAGLMVMLLLELMDGLDGLMARRQGPTEFGGIWDMEIDAYLILLLSAAAVTSGDQPVWALWPGMIRYVFFFLFLWLKPEDSSFPPGLSGFSKTICVATVFCLGSTWYLPPASTVAIGTASVLITVSFLWETGHYIQIRLQSRSR